MIGRVEAASRRFNAYEAQNTALTNEAEAAIERLNGLSASYAEKSSRALQRLEELKQRRLNIQETPDQTKTLDATMERLYAQFHEAEAKIKLNQRKLDRCYKHLARLEKATRVSTAVRDRIQARYGANLERVSRADPDANPSGESPQEAESSEPANMEDFLYSLIEEDPDFASEAMKQRISQAEFAKKWNKIAPQMRIRSTIEFVQKWEETEGTKTPPPPEGQEFRQKIRTNQDMTYEE